MKIIFAFLLLMNCLIINTSQTYAQSASCPRHVLFISDNSELTFIEEDLSSLIYRKPGLECRYNSYAFQKSVKEMFPDYTEAGGKLDRAIEINKDNKEHGTVRDYSNDGNLECLSQYANGMKDGTEKRFYKNGKLELEREYKKDKRDGAAKGYFENGKLAMDANFKNDLIHGTAKAYRNSGELLATATFDNGSPLNGICHNRNSTTRVLTEAELEKFGFYNFECDQDPVED